MRFYTFGAKENPAIMLIPGTCCHWTIFEEVRPLLEKYFHVVVVSFDGFDETEQTVFSDMITETEKMEEYIIKNYGGTIECAYGCSLGGSFVGLLIERGKVHINHGIIGSSDMDDAGKVKAWLQGVLVSNVLYGAMKRGELPSWMKKMTEKKLSERPEMRDYMEKFMAMMGFSGQKKEWINKKSIFNQFYSDLVTKVGDNIQVAGTTIHVFYASKMGEMYLERYHKHFKNSDIRKKDMQHEELLLCYPKEWVSEVCACCNIAE